jgi:hypothetical protein
MDSRLRGNDAVAKPAMFGHLHVFSTFLAHHVSIARHTARALQGDSMNRLFLATALAAILPLTGHAQSTSTERVRVHIDCPDNGAACPAPPPPPVPHAVPAVPAPPAPPAPAAMAFAPPPPHAPRPPHAPIAPPPPPPPPAAPAFDIPDVPAAAHAACAAKAAGSAVTWKLDAHATMQGTCDRKDGKMRFRMRSYRYDA